MNVTNSIRKRSFMQIRFIIWGCVVGLAAGLVVGLFRFAIEKIFYFVKLFYLSMHDNPLMLVLAVTGSILIGLLIGWILKGDENIRGSGIPQVEGKIQGEIELHWWSVLWRKFIAGTLSIGTGLFLGREGPSIQLGAVAGQGINQLVRGNSTDEKILITSGASAGLAAAFNAPVAGLLFGLEEIHHHFSSRLVVACFVSAITANFISLNIFGMKPVLYMSDLPAFPLNKYLWLVLLGIILAIFGVIYQKILFRLSDWYARLPLLPAHLYGIIPLLLVVPLGYFIPGLLGGGAEVIYALNSTYYSFIVLIFIFVFRFIFSMISYGSGLPGGIFLPMLTLGASLGAIFGRFSTYFGVDETLLRSFIVFAMAGFFTAVCKAPLTGMILVSEMVGSLQVLMPIAIVSLSAYIFADLMGNVPVYEGLLSRLIGEEEGHRKGFYTTFVYPVEITNDSLVGTKVKDYPWPKDSLLVLIRKGDQEIVPHGDTVIHAGDLLYISADAGRESTIRRQLDRRKNEN